MVAYGTVWSHMVPYGPLWSQVWYQSLSYPNYNETKPIQIQYLCLCALSVPMSVAVGSVPIPDQVS